MLTENKKPLLRSPIQFGTPGLDAVALGSMAAAAPEVFARKMQDLIDSGELRWDKVRNLQTMFHNLVDIEVPVRMEVAGRERAVMASAFPLLAGGMTIAGLNEAYDAVPTIGQDLVTDVDDNKRVSIYAAITSMDVNEDKVKEGDDFPEISAGEEKYEIRSLRNGRRLSITAETIEENDVTNIVDRINALAEIANERIEEQTLRRVCDIDGSADSATEPYVLRPDGSGTGLYSATANTPGTRAPSGTRVKSNALADDTDLENARALLVKMLNSRGKRINIPMSQAQLVVPDALIGIATYLTKSELMPGTVNELNVWGPRGRYQPQIVSSPKLDDLSTSAWYLGNFKKQFRRKWKLRMEYVTLGMDTESFLRSRIAFQARIAWDVEIGALDYVYVVQNLSGTVAPTP